MFGQERKNETRDFVVLLVQGEMAGVEQMDFGIRKIALERLRTGSDERRIVSPPDYQNRRLVLAQPCLPRRIRRDISSGSRTADRPGSRLGRVSTGGRTRQSRYPGYNVRDARCRACDAARSL